MPSSRELFDSSGALTHGHFIFTNGRHSDRYVDKDRALAPSVAARVHAWNIAHAFAGRGIEVVISPAEGAIALGARVADALTDLDGHEVFFAILKKDAESPHGFSFRSTGADWVAGKRALIVEDVLTTGGSARKAVGATRAVGAEVVALAAFANRESVTAGDLGVPELFTLLHIPTLSWPPERCPLCQAGVPITETLGHGKQK